MHARPPRFGRHHDQVVGLDPTGHATAVIVVGPYEHPSAPTIGARPVVDELRLLQLAAAVWRGCPTHGTSQSNSALT